jgi:hypothetical protein
LQANSYWLLPQRSNKQRAKQAANKASNKQLGWQGERRRQYNNPLKHPVTHSMVA